MRAERRSRSGAAALRLPNFATAATSPPRSEIYLLRLGHHGAPDEWVDPRRFSAAFPRSTSLGRAPAHFDRRAARALAARSGAAGWTRNPRAAGSRRNSLPTGARTGATSVADLLKGNLLLPGDAREWLAVLGGTLPPLAPEAAKAIAEAGPEFFDAALASFTETAADLRTLAERLKSRTGRKGKALYMPLRFALTGRHDGPELAALLAAMPQALVRDRLAGASRMRGA